MTTPFVLRDASVLDEAGGFEGPLDVAVADGRVVEVGRNVAAPPGAAEIDPAGLWLMPGVFDCHTHVAIGSLDLGRNLQTPASQRVLEAAFNLRRTLEGGVTFVRDATSTDAGMRTAVELGYVEGPRLQVCIVGICETGGNYDGFLAGPGIETSVQYIMPDLRDRPPFLVDGPDEMRKAVRTVLRAGADWIKLHVTGGPVKPGSDDEPQLTRAEIEVAVFEARRKRKGVMVHAFGGEGLDTAVDAGVTSVEHGMFLSEQQARRMAETGCWLVPTLAIRHAMIQKAEQGLLAPAVAAAVLDLQSLLGQAVAVARAAGVRMALGTDFYSGDLHGKNLVELKLMHDAGLTAAETLLAATIRGAELCGVADRYGRIAPGYVFDAIVLDEDPSDISLFGREGVVTGVFKGGSPVVVHPRLDGAVRALRSGAA